MAHVAEADGQRIAIARNTDVDQIPVGCVGTGCDRRHAYSSICKSGCGLVVCASSGSSALSAFKIASITCLALRGNPPYTRTDRNLSLGTLVSRVNSERS